MAKVIAFPGTGPEKFGFKSVKRVKNDTLEKPAQLNLFSGGKVVNLNPLTPFEEALVLDEQHDAKAKEFYQKAIEKGDAVADAYCNLGILESESKNYTKAIDCFTLSLKEDPRHYEAHYNLANVYAEVGNLPLAKVHYQLSIAINPTFSNSHFNLGLAFVLSQEIEEAIQSLLRFKRLAPSHDHAAADELINDLSN